MVGMTLSAPSRRSASGPRRGAQEPLQRLGGVEAVQDAQLVVVAQLRLGTLHVLADPALLGGIQDVGVVHAEGPAVGVAQQSQDLPQRQAVTAPGRCRQTVGFVHLELPVEVPDGEPVAGRVEVLVQVGLVQRQRVQLGDEVAAVAVGGDEGVHLRLLEGHRRGAVGPHDVPPPLHLLEGTSVPEVSW